MKKEWVQYSSKRTKNSKLATKMEAFQLFLRARSAIIASTLNLDYALLTFLLLTVHNLLIWHYIFKDYIGRNDVWNFGYGKKSGYVLVEGGENMLYSCKRGFLEGKAERVEDGNFFPINIRVIQRYLNQIMSMVSKFVHFFPQGECFIR